MASATVEPLRSWLDAEFLGAADLAGKGRIVKSPCRAAGWLAIAGGLLLALTFLLLRVSFGYPEIVRATPAAILDRLREQRHLVPYLYHVGVGGGGLAVILFSELAAKVFSARGEDRWSSLGRVCGILGGFTLLAGTLRYPFLFPFLADERLRGAVAPEVVDLVFASFNRYAGVALAEHVQFLFTSLMLAFFGMATLETRAVPRWIGAFGLATAAALLYGDLEPFGALGAFALSRVAAGMAAIWLITAGVALLRLGQVWRASAPDGCVAGAALTTPGASGKGGTP